MINIAEYAEKLATKYHTGQKRRDGKDYITHCSAVSKIAATLYDSKQTYGLFAVPEFVVQFLTALGWTHDILEDCEISAYALEKEIAEAIGSKSIA